MSYKVRFEVECEIELPEDGQFYNDLQIVDLAVETYMKDCDVLIKPCHVEPLVAEDEEQ